MKRLILFCLLAASFQACYYDKLNELHPGTADPCDTSLAATFNKSVVLVVRTNCVSCHSGSSPSGDLRLETYNDVVASAKSGKLLSSMQRTGYTKPMPPDSKIRDCEISKVQTWILNGYPEN